MISKHDEIEAKLAADDVSVKDFKRYIAETLDIERFLHVEGPDDYYESGVNVVRHRMDPNGAHELTVKRRKSESSTRDCHEIDLHFAKGLTGPKDVRAFLEATGFTYKFTLVKDSHIFWAVIGGGSQRNILASFVIYDAWRGDEPQKKSRFIEIEAEKGSPCTPETGKRHVRTWVQNLQREFGLGEPLNERLYEIYSGRRYQVL